MSSIVCHKVDTGERNLEVGGALQHASGCDCVCKLRHDHIRRENMTFKRR